MTEPAKNEENNEISKAEGNSVENKLDSSTICLVILTVPSNNGNWYNPCQIPFPFRSSIIVALSFVTVTK